MQAKVSYFTFDELKIRSLYEVLKLRNQVFIVEQNCPYQDLDDLDHDSVHALIYDGNKLAAYARVLKPGLDFKDASAIGRIISHIEYRRKGLGKIIVKDTIAYCEKQWPSFPIKIHAQSYLLPFYKSFGFEPYGEEFLEDGLPHYFMERQASFTGK